MSSSKKAGQGGPADPEGEAGELLRIAFAAALAVIADQRVWDKEAARDATQLLGWPSGVAPRNYTGLLLTFGKSIALECVARVKKAHGAAAVPNDVASPEFQLVLRVTVRAVFEIDRALNAYFQSGTRVAIVRQLQKWIRERDAIMAMRLPSRAARAAALRAAGISKAAASRARTRGLKRSTF